LEEGLAKQDKKLAGAEILLIGIAYKKNIDDMRESPALVLIELLEQAGAQVAFHDPHVPTIPMTREHSGLAGRKSTDLGAASSVDAVLIVTDHDEIDYGFLASEAALIIDTRNAMRNSKDRHNIVKA
jgi:UDP-N-acetyl-D-glucosamine dehydrogenase